MFRYFYKNYGRKSIAIQRCPAMISITTLKQLVSKYATGVWMGRKKIHLVRVINYEYLSHFHLNATVHYLYMATI